MLLAQQPAIIFFVPIIQNFVFESLLIFLYETSGTLKIIGMGRSNDISYLSPFIPLSRKTDLKL